MSTMTNLSSQQLRRAADLKEKINSLEKELAQLLNISAPAAKAPGQRKKMSAAARARMAAAAKARWAKVKGAKPAAAKTGKKRKMSAAAKALISAKLKAAWAARKAAK
jgi:hypothetical protein